MAKNPVVASYVAKFLEMDQMHVYRQLTGMRHEFDMHVFTKRRDCEAYFPYHHKWLHTLAQPLAQALRQKLSERLAQRSWQMDRSELRRWLLHLTRVDAQLLHVYFGVSALPLVPLMKVWQRPVIVSFHGSDFAKKLDEPLHRQGLKQVFECAARLLCRSESIAKDLAALGAPAHKLQVLRTGIPMEDWPKHERSTPEDGAWQIVQSSPFFEKKGLDTTLRAFAIIIKTYPKAKLVLVGKGPLRQEMEVLVAELGLSERVVFAGFKHFGILRNHLNQSHLYLHPSRQAADGDREDVPNAMLEAMATGLPVVATRHGGIPEVIRDGECGLLVPEDHPEALAAASLRLLADHALRQRIGDAGRQVVEENYSQTIQSERLGALYRGLVSLPETQP